MLNLLPLRWHRQNTPKLSISCERKMSYSVCHSMTRRPLARVHYFVPISCQSLDGKHLVISMMYQRISIPNVLVWLMVFRNPIQFQLIPHRVDSTVHGIFQFWHRRNSAKETKEGNSKVMVQKRLTGAKFLRNIHWPSSLSELTPKYSMRAHKRDHVIDEWERKKVWNNCEGRESVDCYDYLQTHQALTWLLFISSINWTRLLHLYCGERCELWINCSLNSTRAWISLANYETMVTFC